MTLFWHLHRGPATKCDCPTPCRRAPVTIHRVSSASLSMTLSSIATGEEWQDYLRRPKGQRHALMHLMADRRSYPDHHSLVADHGPRLIRIRNTEYGYRKRAIPVFRVPYSDQKSAATTLL